MRNCDYRGSGLYKISAAPSPQQVSRREKRESYFRSLYGGLLMPGDGSFKRTVKDINRKSDYRNQLMIDILPNGDVNPFTVYEYLFNQLPDFSFMSSGSEAVPICDVKMWNSFLDLFSKIIDHPELVLGINDETEVPDSTLLIFVLKILRMRDESDPYLIHYSDIICYLERQCESEVALERFDYAISLLFPFLNESYSSSLSELYGIKATVDTLPLKEHVQRAKVRLKFLMENPESAISDAEVYRLMTEGVEISSKQDLSFSGRLDLLKRALSTMRLCSQVSGVFPSDSGILDELPYLSRVEALVGEDEFTKLSPAVQLDGIVFFPLLDAEGDASYKVKFKDELEKLLPGYFLFAPYCEPSGTYDLMGQYESLDYSVNDIESDCVNDKSGHFLATIILHLLDCTDAQYEGGFEKKLIDVMKKIVKEPGPFILFEAIMNRINEMYFFAQANLHEETREEDSIKSEKLVRFYNKFINSTLQPQDSLLFVKLCGVLKRDPFTTDGSFFSEDMTNNERLETYIAKLMELYEENQDTALLHYIREFFRNWFRNAHADLEPTAFLENICKSLHTHTSLKIESVRTFFSEDLHRSFPSEYGVSEADSAVISSLGLPSNSPGNRVRRQSMLAFVRPW